MVFSEYQFKKLNTRICVINIFYTQNYLETNILFSQTSTSIKKFGFKRDINLNFSFSSAKSWPKKLSLLEHWLMKLNRVVHFAKKRYLRTKHIKVSQATGLLERDLEELPRIEAVTEECSNFVISLCQTCSYLLCRTDILSNFLLTTVDINVVTRSVVYKFLARFCK